MGILFISHSSRNNDRAIRVRDWLREQGWRDTFLDLDPEHGLAPGQRWQEELKKAGERCSAVIVLVSPEWNASEWCRVEFLLATQLGKRVFPVLIAPIPIADLPVQLTAHFQLADISLPEIEADGLNRLRLGLRRAGLDPTDFPWPPPDEPNRPPYRGLRTLEEQDAAIFFGRDTQITKGLDALRRLRDGAPERMLVVLGASGSGKSSFLRAGLLARLGRDDENFLVLPTVRPGRAALTGATGLALALGVTPPIEREALTVRFDALRQPVVERLGRYAEVGRQAYSARPPTLILPIDQGEELFAAEQAEGAGVCMALADALAIDDNLLVIITIRSDSFAALQAEPALAAILRLPFDLSALPLAAFSEVIEGPGRIAQPSIQVEEALTAQLVADLDQADALPLLAFTMERLVADYGAGGVLELAEYRDGMGGLGGAIGRAVDATFAAAREDRRVPEDARAIERLARAAFVPWLLRLEGADQEPKRRIALLREIPPDARPLVAHFVDQRLLVTDIRTDGDTTVEVAHEAVLRHWRLLGRWIGEEREALAQAEAVIRAAADWRRDVMDAERKDGSLVHRGARLATAGRLLQRADLAELIGPDGRAYLAACRVAENERQEVDRRQALRQRRLQRLIAVLSLVALAITAVGGWFVISGQRSLSRQTSLFLTNVAQAQASDGQLDRGMRIALAAAHGTMLEPALSDATAIVGDIAYHSMLAATLYGHSASVTTAAFSPDGRGIVTASADNTARVWRDGADGRWTGTPLEGHSSGVHSAAFSPNGRSIVTASYDNTARVWREGADGRWTGTPLEGHSGGISSAGFSPDGRNIVTASYDNTARVWREGADGRWTGTPLEGHSDTVTSAGFSPDGRSIVTGSADKTARVWREGADGRWTGTPLEGHSDKVTSAAFSPDGRSIVTASDDKMAGVWREGADGSWTGTPLEGHSDKVTSAAFSSDGRSIVTASDDKTARVWREGANGRWSGTSLQGHSAVVHSARFSPDGRSIVTASWDKTARVWREGADGRWTGAALEGHLGPVIAAGFSPDGRGIVTASWDKTARVWRKGSDGRWTGAPLEGHSAPANSASFAPDGRSIVTASDDRTARVWREGADGRWTSTLLEGHLGRVRSAAFSPDGRSIVTASDDRTARVWREGVDGRWTGIPLEGHSGEVSSAAFSPNGRSIVTASRDKAARVWREKADGRWTGIPLEGHSASVSSAAFSPDGRSIVTASDDQTARMWREGVDGSWTGTPLEGHSSGVHSAAFSPNGRSIVTASDDKTARVWREGAEGHWTGTPLEGHSDQVTSAAFAPDGRGIVTASWDKTARVWREGADGRWTGIPLEGHSDGVSSAGFSPDGRSIVTASYDKTARVWQIEWLLSDESRAWVSAHDEGPWLGLVVKSACAEKLNGTERRIIDSEGQEVGNERARRLTHGDVVAAPILSGQEGDDVCDWQLPMLDRAMVWLFPGLWTKLSGATPPPW